jgi:polysaccharide export outer membrane protein
MHAHHRWTAAIALVAAIFLSGCAENLRELPSIAELEDTALQASQEYVIGPRDELAVRVWQEPDLSADVEVRLDGKISFPLLDDVQAAGLTAVQLKQVITERLAEYITAPHVTVIVRSIRSKVVYLLGEIQREGAVPFQPEMRVVDAISLAGGFNPFSGKNRVKIIRRKEDGAAQEFLFDYDAYVRGKSLDQNILLLPGDRIIVPEESPFWR